METFMILHKQITAAAFILACLFLSSPALAGFDNVTTMDEISDPDINSAQWEYEGTISPDGLSYYFTYYNGGNPDLYVATRASRSAPFGEASALSELNTGYCEYHPSITEDGLTLVYYKGCSPYDDHLKIVNRASTDVPFENESTIWSISTNEQNIMHELDPHISPDGLTLYYVKYVPSLSMVDIYRATRANRTSPFGSIQEVTAVKTTYQERGPFLTADGLTLFFSSNRAGTGDFNFYRVSRPNTSTEFESANVVAVSSLNSDDYYDNSISLTKDGTEVFFSSARPGGKGNLDLYHTGVVLQACFTEY